MTKEICFFGIYDREYARNKVLMKGFAQNGFTIVECSVNPKEHRRLSKYLILIKKWFRLESKPKLIFVAYPGQPLVWLARLLAPRAKIIFDAFVSFYDSNVFDRKVYSSFHPKAWKDYFLDWYAPRLANYTILDTAEHMKFFRQKFDIPLYKIGRVPISSLFYESASIPVKCDNQGKFIVLFHGRFIPLQGSEYIVQAASFLENESDLVLRFIGEGQELAKAKDLAQKLNLKNIEFWPKVPITEIVKQLLCADISLGIFGLTSKAQRVIPNKVYEALALGRPVITADSGACREFFVDHEHVVFCKAGDGEDLARQIKLLKADEFLRQKIARGGQELFKEKFLPEKLVAELVKMAKI